MMSEKYHMWKPTKRVLVLMLVFFAFSGYFELSATHIVGGEMSFECNGKEWYEITLTMRRDCQFGAEDAPFDEMARVGIFDAFGNPINYLGNLGDLFMPIISRDTVEASLPECGFFGGGVCVEQAIYRAKVWLPYRDDGYVLAYQRCCRNQTLTNVVNPLETGATWFVCLTEETLNTCNSSPRFGEWPEIIICQNEPFVFDHSALDDGNHGSNEGPDSLAYHLFTPFTGGTLDDPKPIDVQGPPYDSLEFAEGYGLDNLIGGEPLRIDPNSGIITANPNAMGQYLVGVLVEEWRNNVLLSKVRRDFEVNVRACEIIPEISFVVDTSLNCESLTVEVTNTSTDMYDFTWDFNYPSDDSSSVVSGNNPGSYTYDQPGTYTIRLSSSNPDNNCEVFVEQVVTMIGPGLTADFDFDLAFCEPGIMQLNLTSTSSESGEGFEITEISWSALFNDRDTVGFGESFTVNAECALQIPVTLQVTSSSGCVSTLSKVIDTQIDAPMDTVYICPGESVLLLENSDLGGGLSFDWELADELEFTDNDNFSDPLASPSMTTTYNVSVNNGIESVEGFVLVIVRPAPQIEISHDTIVACEGGIVSLTISAEEGLEFVWTPPESVDLADPLNPVFSPDSTTTYILETSNGQCVSRDTVVVEVIQIDEECVINTGFDLEKEYFLLRDDSCYFSFTFNAAELNESCGVTNALWTLQIGEEIVTGDGLSFEGAIAVDTCAGVVSILLADLVDDNGCSLASFADSSEVSKTPSILFQGEENGVIKACQSDTINLVLNHNSCWSYGIVTTGEIEIIGENSDSTLVLGYRPEVVVNGNGTVTVTVTDGDTTVTESVDIEAILPVTVGILTDSLVCDGVANVSVITNDTTSELNYAWSLSPDFSEVIATGSVETLNINGDTTIYLMATGTSDGSTFCGSNIASVNVVDMSLNLEVLVDTIDYCIDPMGSVTVINPDSGLPDSTVKWEDSPFIVGDVNDNPVQILASGDETEILLAYMTNHEEGCNQSGEVLIPVLGVLDVQINFEDSITCDKTITVSADSNLPVVGFEWSLSSDFQDLVGGDEATFDLEKGENTIYVRATSADECDSDIDSVVVVFNGLVLSADYDPINTCISNQTVLRVSNECPEQEISAIVFSSEQGILEMVDDSTVIVTAEEGDTAITVTYSAFNEMGCELTETITIKVDSDLDIDISPDSKLCGDQANLMAEVNAPLDSVQIVWSYDETFEDVAGIGAEIEVQVPIGAESVYVMVSAPGHDCTPAIDSASLEDLRFKGIPEFSALNICTDTTGMVTIESNCPGVNLVVEWLEDDHIVGGLNDNPVQFRTLGDEDTIRLTYIVVAVDNPSCLDTGVVEIPVVDELSIDISDDSNICNGLANLSAELNVDEEDVVITWSYSPDFEDVLGSGSSLMVELDTTNEVIYVRSESVGSTACTPAVDSVSLDDINFDPQGSFEPIARCDSDSTTVTVIDNRTGDPLDVTWVESDNIIGESTDNPITVIALEGQDEIVLHFEATDRFGCTAIDSIVVPVNETPCPFMITGTDGTYCAGGDINITDIAIISDCADSLLSFEWGPAEFIAAGGNTANPEIITPDVDQITLTVSITDDLRGCTVDTSFTVELTSISVDIQADPGTEIKPGQPLILTAVTDAGSPTFVWTSVPPSLPDPGNSATNEPDPRLIEDTEFTVVVTDENNCMATDVERITVETTCVDGVFLPTAFTPNGDGVNDVLAVRGHIIDQMELQIYDRWGREVFRAVNPRETWNGQFENNGEVLAPDVYAYQLMVTCNDGEQLHFSGNVSLLR